jgi:hypothetical protein
VLAVLAHAPTLIVAMDVKALSVTSNLWIIIALGGMIVAVTSFTLVGITHSGCPPGLLNKPRTALTALGTTRVVLTST